MAESQRLRSIHRTEPNISIAISHDDEQRKQYIAAYILGDAFE